MLEFGLAQAHKYRLIGQALKMRDKASLILWVTLARAMASAVRSMLLDVTMKAFYRRD